MDVNIMKQQSHQKVIVVLYKYWRNEISTKLDRITVGVAPNESVEKFYLKNRFKPIEFLIPFSERKSYTEL